MDYSSFLRRHRARNLEEDIKRKRGREGEREGEVTTDREAETMGA